MGALGVGYEHIQDFSMPFDMTNLFNFGISESVLLFASNYSNKTLITTENRVFAWGYYNYDGTYQSIVKDISSSIAILPGQSIVDVQPEMSGLYVYLNDGTIIYYHYEDESVLVMHTSLTFTNIIYAQQLAFDSNELFIVDASGMFVITYDDITEMFNVNNLTSSLEGDEVFAAKLNYEAYGELYLYTKEGRIYLINVNTLDFELVVDFVLNPGEELEKEFIVQWDTMAFSTNQGRLIGYNSTVFTFDTSVLNPGEKLLTFEYGSQFFTSEGRVVYRNIGLQELFGPTEQFIVGSESVIRYVTVNCILYAEYSNNTFWQTGGTEFEETIGIEKTTELYQYGTEFTLATPDEKPDYTFNGWVDIYGNLYTETPTEDILLYPYWTLTE